MVAVFKFMGKMNSHKNIATRKMFLSESELMESRFDEKIYTSISLTKLTIFAMSKIIENDEECAYERVVKECFAVFPKRFSLQRYPEWPDGARIKLEISRCRDRGWTTGNEKSSFQITSLGKRVSQEVLKELKTTKAKRVQKKRARDRGDTILKHIRESETFRKFKENKENFNISEGDFRRLVVSTFETPPKVLEQNLNYCIDICEQYGKKQLVEFLENCKKQKASLLKSHIKGHRR